MANESSIWTLNDNDLSDAVRSQGYDWDALDDDQRQHLREKVSDEISNLPWYDTMLDAAVGALAELGVLITIPDDD